MGIDLVAMAIEIDFFFVRSGDDLVLVCLSNSTWFCAGGPTELDFKEGDRD